MQNPELLGDDFLSQGLAELDRDIRLFIEQIRIRLIGCHQAQFNFGVLKVKLRQVRREPVGCQAISCTDCHRAFRWQVMVEHIAAQAICGIRHDFGIAQGFLARLGEADAAR